MIFHIHNWSNWITERRDHSDLQGRQCKKCGLWEIRFAESHGVIDSMNNEQLKQKVEEQIGGAITALGDNRDHRHCFDDKDPDHLRCCLCGVTREDAM